MSILFYGDPHGQWQPLFEAAERQPAAVVLLGDMDRETTRATMSAAVDSITRPGHTSRSPSYLRTVATHQKARIEQC